jgi:hypothetical protein
MHPFDHDYAKHRGSDAKYEERGPSFIMHSYAKKPTTPQKSRPSKRSRGTPSGQTPVQPSKLQCQVFIIQVFIIQMLCTTKIEYGTLL